MDIETAHRIARLERGLRRTRLLGGASLAAAAFLLLAGLARPSAPADDLSVKTLRLVDDRGRQRAALYVADGDAVLGLYDPAGKGRLMLGVHDDGQTGISISHGDRNVFWAGVQKEGLAHVRLDGLEQNDHLLLAAPPKGGPHIQLWDDGKETWGAPGPSPK